MGLNNVSMELERLFRCVLCELQRCSVLYMDLTGDL